jgi:hypothetical protein
MTPAEPRVTCWWYVLNHGLAAQLGDYDHLLAIGAHAAALARWLGIPPYRVPEGPLWVHTWPEWVWARTLAEMRLAGRGLTMGCPAGMLAS